MKRKQIIKQLQKVVKILTAIEKEPKLTEAAPTWPTDAVGEMIDSALKIIEQLEGVRMGTVTNPQAPAAPPAVDVDLDIAQKPRRKSRRAKK